ncbi:MAG: extracellular solute-binding protein [Hyphomicrobiales bacterium]|nr:extracellular solute-binding protein [Hyphomicrobiales bacterium]
MTVSRAVILGTAALAGAFLSQLFLVHAQTPPDSPAPGSVETAQPELPTNSKSDADIDKSTIVNTTSQDKPVVKKEQADADDADPTSSVQSDGDQTSPEAEVSADEGTAVAVEEQADADDADPTSSVQADGDQASPEAEVSAEKVESTQQNEATAQSAPVAQSPGQLTPADPAASNTSEEARPAANIEQESAPASANEIQAATPEVAPEPEPVKIAPEDVKVTIATWSGAYGEAQRRAIIAPFAKETGYDVKTVIHDGSYEELEDQSDVTKWSVVDLNGGDMVRACNDGLLERLDDSFLKAAPNGGQIADDFLPGAIHECGIGSMAWSAVLVRDQRLDEKPGSLEDFFDIGSFPGKRILPKQPRYSLELALMADGVDPEDVYEVLTTRQGQDRAFAKLSSIKDDIIWWEEPAEALGRIVNNEAIMGLAFNGRAFMSIVASEQPLEIVWDHQIYTFDYWSVPRGAEFKDAALEFIGHATDPNSLAAQSTWLPYGPSRRSASVLVGRHPELDIDMKPFLPTHADHFGKALMLDDAFWARNEAELVERFSEWVEGRQLPPQKSALQLQ